ncbi:hypothetical protein [Streptomyces sp. NPDC026673]|uniref:hypothetical protein n=1 Tax=Streptomyces sp. NPDC026673 TaxID=3155724 RepID=UPI0033C6B3D5
MSFPPPSPPDDPRSGQGGGFGPPPGGFGPPQYQPPSQAQPQYQPQPPYQNQPQFPGPPQPGGGYGYPPPPQPPRSGGGAKVAAIAIGAVVLIAVVIGGLAVTLSGGEDDDKGASGSSTSSSPRSSAPGTPATSAGSTEPDPSETFRKYVVLDPGQCFDDPGLDSSVTEVTTVSCNGPHDAEVIANETITGTFATEAELKAKVLKLCEADAAKRLKDIKDNPGYYYYALYPKLTGYQVQGKDTISCSLTLSNRVDGKKLTKPLP